MGIERESKSVSTYIFRIMFMCSCIIMTIEMCHGGLEQQSDDF